MNQTLSTELLPEWQRIVDLIAHIAKVPVGLIMGLRDNTLTVLVSSRTKGNPLPGGRNDQPARLRALLRARHPVAAGFAGSGRAAIPPMGP